MAHWNGKTIVRFSPSPYPDYPGWVMIDCGCSNGIEWGGDYPRECKTCDGSGYIAQHIASRTLALYPGGPFCGQGY